MRSYIGSLALYLVFSSVGAAQEHSHAGGHGELGTIHFPNSGKPAAQADFIRGVALLHSFEYLDASRAFQAAQKADPDFALAHWMEALTYRHPLWGEEYLVPARKAFAPLGSTVDARLSRAKTPRERAYGAAIEALYTDAGEKERTRAFADSMRALADAHPADIEASAFAALALMGHAVQVGRPDNATLMSDAVKYAQKVFARNAKHPGAAHYLIHLFDDPRTAEQGLPFAREYAAIAPDAQHALHMPSHIFLQMGAWDDVVASNERAWAASRAWAKRSGLDPSEADYHSLAWLQYAYLQQGRYRSARALIDTVRTLMGAGAAGKEYGMASVRLWEFNFQYASNTGDWSSLTAKEPFSRGAGSARAIAYTSIDMAQAGVAATARGDSARALELVRNLRARSDSALPGDFGKNAYQLAENLIAAGMARMRGDQPASLTFLSTAGDLEAKTSPTGPPLFPPALPVYGNALLAMRMNAEAARAFERELELRRNHSPSLLGLARARTALGDAKGAREAYGKLLANWKKADVDLALLREVKAGAAGERVAGR